MSTKVLPDAVAEVNDRDHSVYCLGLRCLTVAEC